MARLKTSSRAYEKGFRRIAAVQSIDPDFDLGNGLVAKDYQQAITDVKAAMDSYNTLLSTLDEKLNTLKAKEKSLDNWNERILNGVASKYGKDSNEYEQAGGVRKSERKKPKTKSAAPTG
jgi:uncharacterized protein YukE